MELINAARHTVADLFTALDKTGHEHLVVVVKATYALPARNDQMPRPQMPPQPIAAADQWAGEPGLSAPLYESDYVLRKARCDLLFNACAQFAPDETGMKRLVAGFEFGDCQKMLSACGARQWKSGALGSRPSDPEVIEAPVPLHMGNAYGGTVRMSALKVEPELLTAHPENPMGTGYCPNSALLHRSEHAPPMLELSGHPVRGPTDKGLQPAALSVLPRTSQSRGKWAGTYDEAWRREQAPMLPHDFDERYFQSAPEDQQVPHPNGGERVRLHRMVKGHAVLEFVLPKLSGLRIKLLTREYAVYELAPVVDTLYFETELQRMSVVWRASLSIQRWPGRLLDVQTLAIGTVCKSWWAAKASGQSSCSGCDKARSTEKPPEGCEEGAA